MDGNKPEAKERQGLLSPFRVLDLADDKGSFCGFSLADLGAEVIRIERPGGDPERDIAPYYKDVPDREGGLQWFLSNANKKGITLNIQTKEGQAIFKDLVKSADFVIESFPPGYMESLGLGYKALEQVNKRVIMVSITPFGQDGPYKDYKTSDLVAMSLSGLVYITGDADRAPVRISVEQAYLNAGLQATVGAMIAHWDREMSGEGQLVDVSILESVLPLVETDVEYWDCAQVLVKRVGTHRHRGRFPTRIIWPCKDGHIAFYIALGKYGRRIEPLVKWMDEEGMAFELKEVKDWEALDLATFPHETLLLWEKRFLAFFAKHTKQEITARATAGKMYISQGSSVKELVDDPELLSRDFYREVRHDKLGSTLKYPGMPYKFSAMPPKPWRCAPRLGEHNTEVYTELGIDKDRLEVLKRAKVI